MMEFYQDNAQAYLRNGDKHGSRNGVTVINNIMLTPVSFCDHAYPI